MPPSVAAMATPAYPTVPTVKGSELPSPLKSFLDSGKWADAYIRIEGTGAVFAVHRVVLALQSRVLEKLLQGQGNKGDPGRDRTTPVPLRLDSPALDAVFGDVLAYIYGRAVQIRDANLVPLYLVATDLEVAGLRRAALDAAHAIVGEEPHKAAVFLRQLVRTRPPHAARALEREDALARALVEAIAARCTEHADNGKRLWRALREMADEEDLLRFIDHLRTLEAALQASPAPLSASVKEREAEGREAKRRRAEEAREREAGGDAAAVFAFEEELAAEEGQEGTSLPRYTEEDERLMQNFVSAMNIAPSQAIAIPRRLRPAAVDFVI